jgi:hypothetical protein
MSEYQRPIDEGAVKRIAENFDPSKLEPITVTRPWSELKARKYKRWYQFGRRSPIILYKRLHSKYRPVFRLLMAWQRARRGYSDDQLWSLSHSLAHLTVAGVEKMREWKHGYPTEFSEPPYGDGKGWEAWDAILAQIQDGFQAWIDEDGWFQGKPEAEEKFNDAMVLYAKWFSALWD